MNQRELAEALNVDPAVVTRLKARGMPVHSVEAAREWRLAHGRRNRIATAPRATRAAPAAGSHTEQLLEARLLRERSDAQTAAIKLAELQGEVVRVDTIKLLFGRVLTDCKTKFLGLPSRMAPLLAHEMTPAEVQRLLHREINEILIDLSEGGETACNVGGKHVEA